jgi:hypothetical protein
LYLRFDDGTPYYPVGHNVCWYDDNRAQLRLWLERMGEAGENWTRYWMVPYVGQGIEWGWVEPEAEGLGRYSLVNSRKLDYMLEQARLHGIRVQLCLDSFNGWNTWAYTNWPDNPYKVSNGGMLTTPGEYWANPEAQSYAKRLIRYIVARWAYDTTVLCWEFWNEVNITDEFYDHFDEVTEWHRIMGEYIRLLDPFDHLRSTSHAQDGCWVSDVWYLEEMDFINLHRYTDKLPADHVRIVRCHQELDKPVVIGEGNLLGAPGSDYDDATGEQSLHDMIWATAVSESGGMSWWHRWIHDHNLYTVFEPLVAFLRHEDWAPLQLRPAQVTVDENHVFEVYGSAGPGHAYLFGLHPYPNAEGLELTVHHSDPGAYEIEYWDTYSGDVIATECGGTNTGDLVLTPPDFERDIAVKVERLGDHYLLVDPMRLFLEFDYGSNPTSDAITLQVFNVASLSYEVTVDADWVEVTPASGTVSDEPVQLAVSYHADELLPGVYQAGISIVAPQASNSPVVVDVELVLNAFPADFDGDRDVDQSDFGYLQACMTGPGFLHQDAACLKTDLDGDRDTDIEDLDAFLPCKLGSGVELDPSCLEQQ